MAQPTFAQTPNTAVVGTSTANNGLVLTPTCPAASASSVMILAVHNDAGSLSSVSVAQPAGWNVGPTIYDSSGTIETALFWRTGFTGTSVSVTLNATTGGSAYYGWAQLFELSGANVFNPFAAFATSYQLVAGAGTYSGASVTSPTTGGLAIGFWGYNDLGNDTTGNTTQSGWTVESNSGITSQYAAGYVAYQNAATTAGTAVTPTINVVGVSYSGVTFESITVVIAPSGPPPYQPNYLRQPILSL